jgi:uncharacterized protein YneF (UPF0154 family)
VGFFALSVLIAALSKILWLAAGLFTYKNLIRNEILENPHKNDNVMFE